MIQPRLRRGYPASMFLVACLVLAKGATAQDCPECCFSGPLPKNPTNNLLLCSPSSNELRAFVTPEGALLEWDAPDPQDATFVGPIEAIIWETSPGDTLVAGDPPPGITVTGTYLGQADRRIELSVTKINGADSVGTTGVGTVIIFWQSTFEVTPGGGIIGGEIIIDSSTVNTAIPFVRDDTGDTLSVAGLRLHVADGLFVRNTFRSAFTVEDFEGYVVWRWLSDPTLEPEAWGRYNRPTGRPVPDTGQDSWPGTTPNGAVVTFRDTAVFDGLTYHYAVTTYDLGFKPKNGQTFGVFLNSPLEGANGMTGALGPTQILLEFRKDSPEEFTAVVAYPNPYRQAECRATDKKGTCQVHFKNMPETSQLLIYTVAGDLVREIPHNAAEPGTISWDTLNGAGNEVASGVYIYKVADLSSGRESFGRLTVIR